MHKKEIWPVEIHGPSKIEMTPNSNNKLQYIIACMATHSMWIDVLQNDFSEVDRCVKLSEEEKEKLRSFINNYGKRLHTSAVLMEEKRWRELFLAMKYVPKLIPHIELKQYWADYLRSCSMVEHIPGTPILESIKFLKYLAKMECHNLIVSEVIKYEIIKNNVMAYDFLGVSHDKKTDLSACLHDRDKYRVVINPSCNIGIFNVFISSVIAALNGINNSKINECDYISKNEEIAFYKDRKNGSVKVVSLDRISKAILNDITECENLKILLEKVNERHVYGLKIMNVMLANDLISIVKETGHDV